MDSSVPPCFRTSSSCKLERSCAAVAGEGKLSKSKKRHLREQRSAVRRAAYATEDLKHHLPFVDTRGFAAQASESQVSSDELYSLMKQMLVKVDSMQQIFSNMFNANLATWCCEPKLTSDPESTLTSVDTVLNILQGGPPHKISIPLRQDAPEFVPAATIMSGEPDISEDDVCSAVGGEVPIQDDDAHSAAEFEQDGLSDTANILHPLGSCEEREPYEEEKHRNQPILKDVAGSRSFERGDVVVIVDGPYSGKIGTVCKPGGHFTVEEHGETMQFESLCTVQLEDEPNDAGPRVMSQDQLEKHKCEVRSRLQSLVEKTVQAMEANAMPGSCHHLLTPVIQKALDSIRQGSAHQCGLVEDVLKARIVQLGDDIFEHLSVHDTR